jgi:hypothetical protein
VESGVRRAGVVTRQAGPLSVEYVEYLDEPQISRSSESAHPIYLVQVSGFLAEVAAGILGFGVLWPIKEHNNADTV